MSTPDFTCPHDGFGRGAYQGRVQLSPAVQLICFRCEDCALPYSVQVPINPPGPEREAVEAAIAVGGGVARPLPLIPPPPRAMADKGRGLGPAGRAVLAPKVVELSGKEISKLEAAIKAAPRKVARTPAERRNGRRERAKPR